MPKIDIITGEARHRTWTLEEKLSLLQKAFAPGAVAAHVAREANVNTGQLYTWRKRFMKKKPEGSNGFARVVAISDQAAEFPPCTVRRPDPVPAAAFLPAAETAPRMIEPSGVAGVAYELPAIEVEVDGNKVRIPGSMPPALATAVLRALVHR
jgi:transposase-like protein